MRRFVSFMLFVLLATFIFQSYKTMHEQVVKSNEEINKLKSQLNVSKNIITEQNKQLNSPLYKAVYKCSKEQNAWFVHCVEFEKKFGKF